ncbi:hypothetical protein HGG70_05215 [Rhodobacteraceae bacterium R_SAG4]|nr:hypothetical protein [Rhodobacteraceae bacterium R_SAG4]
MQKTFDLPILDAIEGDFKIYDLKQVQLRPYVIAFAELEAHESGTCNVHLTTDSEVIDLRTYVDDAPAAITKMLHSIDIQPERVFKHEEDRFTSNMLSFRIDLKAA